MRTIETQVTVKQDGQLTVQIPAPSIPAGKHRAVLVIDEHVAAASARVPKPPLALKVWKWEAWPTDATFRREDFYEDDGR
jgi:hypothetical protein